MPDALVAGALAGAAALSLPLGAVVALVLRPSARIVALVMGFGSGALIHAVVTELAVDPAAEMVAEHGYGSVQAWAVLATGFLAGCILYVATNRLLEGMGSGVRWRHRVRKRALAEKRAQALPVLQALSRSQIAASLSPQDAEELLPFVRRLSVAAGQTVYRQGDHADGIYLVASGAFALRHKSHQASAEAVETVTPLEQYSVVGGLGVLSGEPHAATLMATSDGELLMLARVDFEHAAEKVPCLRKILAAIVTHELYLSARNADGDDADEWQRTAAESIEHLTRSEVEAATERHGEAGSPLAIFVGTLQDGIPESLAIGASFAGLATFAPTFMVAVFLSNLPEAVAGTSALRNAKFTVTKVMLMWAGLVVGSALAGTLGYVLLNGASAGAVAFLGSVAGGGVVAMLAMTMMPEAYESGHAGVAPATIIGFLASLFLAVLEMGSH
ncbi:MAG: cyclic nucleotide-binding domain-containing protein [Chloroflexota bacterium]